MRATATLLLLLILSIASPALGQTPIEVYFSPNDGCTDAIV